MQFNLEDYISVSDRILEFWEQVRKTESTGSILTEIYHLDTAEVKNRLVVIKASIVLNGNTVSTGWAKEREGTAGANRTSFIENAETSAIGRALANYGASVTKGNPGSRPSREEMESVALQEEELANILGKIKSIGLQSGDEALQRDIKANWKNLKDDIVFASVYLATIENTTGIKREDD